VARTRGRDERQVVDLQAVEHAPARVAQEPQGGPGQLGARRAQGRDRAVQDHHVDLGARVPGGERLPVGPDPQDRVVARG
jgi:hypothetical protein